MIRCEKGAALAPFLLFSNDPILIYLEYAGIFRYNIFGYLYFNSKWYAHTGLLCKLLCPAGRSMYLQ